MDILKTACVLKPGVLHACAHAMREFLGVKLDGGDNCRYWGLPNLDQMFSLDQVVTIGGGLVALVVFPILGGKSQTPAIS